MSEAIGHTPAERRVIWRTAIGSVQLAVHAREDERLEQQKKYRENFKKWPSHQKGRKRVGA